MQGIVHQVLLLLHFDLGGRADLDNRHAAGQLGHAFLQLLAVVVRGGLLDLGANLLDPRLDLVLAAGAIDDGGILLADDHALGLAEFLEGGLLQAQTNLLGDHGATGEDGDVLQHGLAPVTEAGRLDRGGLEGTAQVVDHQGGQGLTLDVFGDDQQRATGLGRGLEHRQ